jgi:hypothetical protein
MYIAAAIAGISVGVGLVLGGLVSNLITMRLFTSPKRFREYTKKVKELAEIMQEEGLV